jgi:hypothetical protein
MTGRMLDMGSGLSIAISDGIVPNRFPPYGMPEREEGLTAQLGLRSLWAGRTPLDDVVVGSEREGTRMRTGERTNWIAGRRHWYGRHLDG